MEKVMSESHGKRTAYIKYVRGENLLPLEPHYVRKVEFDEEVLGLLRYMNATLDDHIQSMVTMHVRLHQLPRGTRIEWSYVDPYEESA